LQGSAAPTCAPGPSNSYYVTGLPAVDLRDVAEFTYKEITRLAALPAGSYLITGNVVAAKRDGSVLIRCRIKVGDQDSTPSSVQVGEVAGSAFLGNITVTAPFILSGPADAVLQCDREYADDPGSATYVESIRMHATKVGSLELRTDAP
jgi:hypothetical protein